MLNIKATFQVKMYFGICNYSNVLVNFALLEQIT